MKKTVFLAAAIACMGFASLITPASALTLQQAQTEVAGYHCAGSTCTKNSSTTVQTTSIGKGAEIHTDHDNPYGKCGAFMIEIKAGSKSLCVFEGPQVGMTETVITNGTRTDCVKTTKVLVWNGPFTSRANEWSVNTSTGAC